MYNVLIPFDGNEDRAIAQAEMVLKLPRVAESVEATLLHVGDAGDPLELPAGERLNEMLKEAGVTVRTEMRKGKPAEEILAAGREFAADLIVLGGRKRSPLGSFLFGSTSQAVFLDADRPVTVTGAQIKEDPSHQCRSCGEAYYSETSSDIETCRRCGGTKVDRIAAA